MSVMGFNANNTSIRLASVPLNEFKHALFLGRTGDGKTSGGINPTINSRMAEGYGMLIFDEKGKEHKTVKLLAHQHNRLDDVIEIGKPHGIRVNLLHEMGERELEKFCRNFMKGDDSSWTEGSVNMFMSLSKWLILLKTFYRHSINEFDISDYVISLSKNKSETGTDEIEHTISIKPLTLKELANYFQNTEAFLMVTQFAQSYVDVIAQQIKGALALVRTMDESLAKNLYRADAMIEELNGLSNVLKGLRIKNNTSEASGNNGTFFMLSSTISMLGDNNYINDPKGSDISTLLNSGKIIVVNTQAFGASVLSSMLSKTLSGLSLRSKFRDAHPICVVIDEANRVLSRDSDIHTDILRESRVEIIMATQNHSQMRIKMGAERWEAFADNFNTRFIFVGKSDSKNNVLNVLDENSDTKLEATPMYFNEDDLNDAELNYQHKHAFYSKQIKNSNEIALYDHALYEQKRSILIYNIRTHEMRMEPYTFSSEEISTNTFRHFAQTIVNLTKEMAAQKAKG